ncbi:hypothetical protein WM25_04400 [Burkholderia ubonensis]|nr:hypothetical protein WM25_04400 [Burkholderia ubonensis]
MKTSLAITEKSGLIVGARTFTGNPYEGHTLAAQLEQTRILLEAVPGDPQPKTVLADLGYRGVDAELGSVKLIHRGKYKTLSEKQRKWLKRRQAVEPIIGHVKQDHGLRRCWLKGATGDALHAVLCATGFNLRWLLRAIARLGIGPVSLRWLRHVKRATFAHYFLTIAQQLRVGAQALAISMGGGVDARDSTRDEVALRAARSGRLNFACPTGYPFPFGSVNNCQRRKQTRSACKECDILHMHCRKSASHPSISSYEVNLEISIENSLPVAATISTQSRELLNVDGLN